VFCPKCGKELPNDSQFCLGCGDSLYQPPKKKTKWALWALLPILLIVLFWLNTSHTTVSSAMPQVFGHQHTQATHAAITVRAVSFASYSFTVPSDATDVSITGHFSAAGGMGNDIEVFVLGQDAFVNFRNNHPANAYYSSGKVTQDTIKATLPGGGTYYLVFSNRFSLITSKAVQLDAALHYTD
jgi:predicted nucleic acid-binding Zn ribbon protein